jgi:hypothetical protein
MALSASEPKLVQFVSNVEHPKNGRAGQCSMTPILVRDLRVFGIMIACSAAWGEFTPCVPFLR